MADGGPVLFYGANAPARRKSGSLKRRSGRRPIPAWALSPAPPKPARRDRCPISLAADDESAPPPSEAMRAAALRGTWIHQLLERLPAVAPGERAGAAHRWLERSAA